MSGNFEYNLPQIVLPCISKCYLVLFSAENIKKAIAMKTALFIGSTGLTGSKLLQLLLNSAKYGKIISFSYRDIEVKHPKLTHHIVDFDQPDSYCHLVKGDDFFCTLGTTIKKAGSKEAFKKVDYFYPKEFARCAADHNVAQFLIISALGADAKSSNFYIKTKGEIEAALRNLNFKHVSVMRPSLY